MILRCCLVLYAFKLSEVFRVAGPMGADMHERDGRIRNSVQVAREGGAGEARGELLLQGRVRAQETWAG